MVRVAVPAPDPTAYGPRPCGPGPVPESITLPYARTVYVADEATFRSRWAVTTLPSTQSRELEIEPVWAEALPAAPIARMIPANRADRMRFIGAPFLMRVRMDERRVNVSS